MARCDVKSALLPDKIFVDTKEIQDLFQYFSKDIHHTDPESVTAMQKCTDLLKLNYNMISISNFNNELAQEYPSHLLIIESERVMSGQSSRGSTRTPETIYENVFDARTVREQMCKARLARCRTRFPMPVIFYKGKYVCRSATLSGGPEIYGRTTTSMFYSTGTDSSSNKDSTAPISSPNNESVSSPPLQSPPSIDWQLIDRIRYHDISLLKTLNVGIIVDLMLENKKVKYGVKVSSSEKVDKEKRYVDFNILSLPYPGCEFFKDFRESNYVAEELFFNWDQSYIDAILSVPDIPLVTQLEINWKDYKNWDLVQLTKNYVKLILKYLQEGSAGILVHCISGWDRTPLFISLIRLSLWADGLAHQALDAHQMLYLTIAYDWLLFGHHLCDRLVKGEDILFFCFYVLKYLAEDDFSICSPGRNNRMRRTEINKSPEKIALEVEDEDQAEDLPMLQEPFPLFDPQTDDITESFVELTAPPLSCFPPPKQTSPVNIPERLRPKDDTSSIGGSWQMISGTGSLKSDSSSTLYTSGTNDRGDEPGTSNAGVEDDTDVYSSRQQRLLTVRRLFYRCYTSTIGLKFKDGSDVSRIGAMFGVIAEKVGLSTKM